jgi:hypothetical protein
MKNRWYVLPEFVDMFQLGAMFKASVAFAYANENIDAISSSLSTIALWKEYKAAVVILPRQCGKSTALRQYALVRRDSTRGEKSVIVIPNSCWEEIEHTDNYRFKENRALSLLNKTGGIDPKISHLFIDEFMFLGGGVLDKLLEHDWLSVSMVGSLK